MTLQNKYKTSMNKTTLVKVQIMTTSAQLADILRPPLGQNREGDGRCCVKDLFPQSQVYIISLCNRSESRSQSLELGPRYAQLYLLSFAPISPTLFMDRGRWDIEPLITRAGTHAVNFQSRYNPKIWSLYTE